MSVRMKGKHLLGLSDLSREEMLQIFDQTKALKLDVLVGPPQPILAGKTLAMIFEKPSTRTRISFQVGMGQLGGQAIFLSTKDLQIGRGESIADTSRTISRYCDAIMARVHKHTTIEELGAHSRVPVINGLSDMAHPCQVLTDLYTILEKKGRCDNRTIAYYGDGGNNMASSLLVGCAVMGMHTRICCPDEDRYAPRPSALEQATKRLKRHGGSLEIIHDPKEAAKGADVLYTDVWTSMGMEAEREERLETFQPYQINDEILALADTNAIVMHCLPAHRGEEITASVIDGPASVVFDQAENRMHVQKAILALLVS